MSGSEHSTDATRQQDVLANAALCRSLYRLSEDPSNQRLASPAKSTVALLAESLPPSQGVPPHETPAHVEVGTASCPTRILSSPSLGGFSDVRRLSPVFSRDEDRWSPRSMSRLFSQSTCGYDFDLASLSHHVSSVAEERRLCGHAGTCQRYTLVTFLVAVLVACATAVVVDMRWTALARAHWQQLLVDEDLPPVAVTVEGNMSVQRAPYLSWTTMTRIETSSRASQEFEGPAGDVTVAHDEQEEAAVIMKVTKPPRSEKDRTRGRKRTIALRRATASLPRRPSSTKRPRTRRPTGTRREKKFDSRWNVMSAPIRRPTKHKCGLAFYTYCSTFRHEAYYRHTTRSCVRTITDDVHVCNHSPNRFTSRSECQRQCVHNQMPSDACFEKTLFSWCNRRDVNASWWVFDGKRCRPWHFPKGLCPSPDDSDVYGSLDECERRCSSAVDVGDDSGGRRDTCRGSGDGVTCDSDVLRFPYFADVSPGGDGRVRCIRASAATLLTHRCLIGSNRFFSEEACKRACMDGATLRRRNNVYPAE
ncbi:hypothetical protein HPB49_000100 [Dermacentor silvarum]|uniref:Uncharacterized protein n=1 Tax=Dermacentor silvarum TaxID=543639 RepID=A0ACB8C6E1_DERSI|nr:hypothetical protein HPB49_000100 [Dermacentor silvarum]